MAKDKLLDWLEDAGCNHYQCTYGVDIECDDCIKRMVAEHDAEVKRKTIDELVEKFKSYICTDEKQTYFYTEFICEIQKIADQMKGESE